MNDKTFYVYVVWFHPKGGDVKKPEMFVFGNRKMSHRFIMQMMNEHGIDGRDIFVKQYAVVRAKQEFGHHGELLEN